MIHILRKRSEISVFHQQLIHDFSPAYLVTATHSSNIKSTHLSLLKKKKKIGYWILHSPALHAGTNVSQLFPLLDKWPHQSAVMRTARRTLCSTNWASSAEERRGKPCQRCQLQDYRCGFRGLDKLYWIKQTIIEFVLLVIWIFIWFNLL